MNPAKLKRIELAVLWVLAIATAVSSARYFVFSAASLAHMEDAAGRTTANWAGTPAIPALHPFSHHPLLLLVHVSGGIVALIFGLFQFLPQLRQSRPKVHRAMGTVYAAGTVVAGLSGFPLSFLFYTSTAPDIGGRLIPAAVGFAVLSLVWPCLTIIAFVRARQHRFAEHRAWMIRSYSLTAAAITTRLIALPLLMITRDPLLTVNLVIVLSGPLNLLFAEMFLRQKEPLATAVSITDAHACPAVNTVNHP